MATILLVCTGNICRSPMAEAFIRRELEERGLEGIRVESSGVAGWEGSPATAESVDAVAEYGLDISGHRARRLTRPMVESADLVVAMTAEQREAVRRLVPNAAPRSFTLKELVSLLDSASPAPDYDEFLAPDQLRQAVATAAAIRESDPDMELLDEDVADPLGLGIESYRAVAWEVEALSRRLVDGLFPGTGAGATSVPGEDVAGLWEDGVQEGSG